MTERLNFRDDGSLEQALGHLSDDVLFPKTPDLAAAFRTQVQAIPRSRSIVARRWTLAAVAAALVVALGLSIPGARSTVAGWLQFAGIEIEFGGDRGGPDDAPVSIGGELFLGRRVTLAEALSSVSFEVVAPTSPALGQVAEIYLDHRDGTPVISMLYPASEEFPEIGPSGAGLLLMQFDPAGDTTLYIKNLPVNSSAEFLTVNGSAGAWIEDGSLAIPPATDRVGAERPSAHVLIWERDGITVRMETNLSREEALAIAETLAPISSPATAAP